MPTKKTGTRTGANARSGPSTPRAARTRRPVEVTLSDEARAVLLAAMTRTGESRSALVEGLVLAHLTPTVGKVSEQDAPPAFREGVFAGICPGDKVTFYKLSLADGKGGFCARVLCKDGETRWPVDWDNGMNGAWAYSRPW